MEAYGIMSCSPSTQVVKKSQDDVAGVELRSRERRVCRIVFEEYLNIWMKIATTNPELLMESESLNEFIKYTERLAVHYESTDDLVKAQHNTPVQKKRQKKDTKAKQMRVERMRRLYMQSEAPDLQISDPIQSPDELENWEQEMDELVEWTHSLSLKELDNL